LSREPFVQLEAGLVEAGRLRRAVVRADDRRVAAGAARAEVALLEHRDVADPMLAREVVRDREPLDAAADDDDVVRRLQLALRPPHPPREEQVLHERSRSPSESKNAPRLTVASTSRPRASICTFSPDVAASGGSSASPIAAPVSSLQRELVTCPISRPPRTIAVPSGGTVPSSVRKPTSNRRSPASRRCSSAS